MAEYLGVECPNCGRCSSRVLDSRPHLKAQARQRHCRLCGEKFSTFEMAVELLLNLEERTNVAIVPHYIKSTRLQRQRLLAEKEG